MTLKGIESVLQTIMHQRAWQHQQRLQTIIEIWDTQLPTKTKQNSRPHSIKDNILFVATANTTWSQHLTLQRLRICQQLNTKLKPSDTLQDIRFSAVHWRQTPAYSPLADPHLDHPSRTAPRKQPRRSPEQSPTAAVRSWLQQQQNHLENAPVCPKCQVPTPIGELRRWQMCSCCIAQKWSQDKRKDD